MCKLAILRYEMKKNVRALNIIREECHLGFGSAARGGRPPTGVSGSFVYYYGIRVEGEQRPICFYSTVRPCTQINVLTRQIYTIYKFLRNSYSIYLSVAIFLKKKKAATREREGIHKMRALQEH